MSLQFHIYNPIPASTYSVMEKNFAWNTSYIHILCMTSGKWFKLKEERFYQDQLPNVGGWLFPGNLPRRESIKYFVHSRYQINCWVELTLSYLLRGRKMDQECSKTHPSSDFLYSIYTFACVVHGWQSRADTQQTCLKLAVWTWKGLMPSMSLYILPWITIWMRIVMNL